MLFSFSSSGYHYRLPDWFAFPRHCCWKHSSFVVIQGQQGTENSEQLLPAELGICRPDHRNTVHEPIHHLHYHGPVGSGASSV